MSGLLEILIEERTAAANALMRVDDTPNYFQSTSGKAVRHRLLYAWGLEAGEEILLQLPKVEGADIGNDAHWMTMKVGGNDVKLTSDDNHRAVYSAARIRVKKPSTTAAVGVAAIG